MRFRWKCPNCGSIWYLNWWGLLHLPFWKLKDECVGCKIRMVSVSASIWNGEKWVDVPVGGDKRQSRSYTGA